MIRRALSMTFRVRAPLQDAIRAEQLAAGDGIDATEALHRLGVRNAKERKYYLSSMVSNRDEVELFAADLARLLVPLESVRQRLGGPLREIPDDPGRNANIAEWRRISEELPAQIRLVVDVAFALCEKICGISLSEIEQIDSVAKLIRAWLPNREKQLKTAEDNGEAAKIAELNAVCIGYRSFLAVVERQLGRSY
jgi:hypothetical protein